VLTQLKLSVTKEMSDSRGGVFLNKSFYDVSKILKKYEVLVNLELSPYIENQTKSIPRKDRFHAVFDGKLIIITHSIPFFDDLKFTENPFETKTNHVVCVSWDRYGKNRYYKSMESAVCKVTEAITKGVTRIDNSTSQFAIAPKYLDFYIQNENSLRTR
jgi:hypothetical protein